MTTVIFETATLADAVKKAERIAPTKGSAFDKAAGLVLSVDPASQVVVIKATNLSVFSMEWVDTVEMSGEPSTWRVPSKLFASVMGGLPIGTGRTVKLEEKSVGRIRQLHLTSGRVRAKFNLMMTDYYPEWEVFSPDGLVSVDDLGGKIGMAEWAAQKDGEPPLSGVYFDGERVLACDRYRLGTVPIEIPGLVEPITVPAGILSSVLKQTGEVKVGVHEGQLLIMPDDTTQIKTVVYDIKYPPVERIMQRETPYSMTIRKAPLLETLQRVSAFAGNDRFPILRLFIGKGQVAAMMNTDQIGDLLDVIDLPEVDHDRFEVKFTPRYLIEAINACPNDELTIGYDTSDPMKIFYIDGGSGYEAWVMPRKGLTPEERAEKEVE